MVGQALVAEHVAEALELPVVPYGKRELAVRAADDLGGGDARVCVAHALGHGTGDVCADA